MLNRRFLFNLILICIFHADTSHAQAPLMHWARAFGGSSTEITRHIKIDTTGSGDIYVCGYFLDSADFDPSASFYILNSNGGYDVFIAKYDALGNFIWAKSFGGVVFDDVYGFDLDNSGSGHFYMAGVFHDTVDFDPGSSTVALSSNGNSDIYIVKFDSAGNLIWVNTIGGLGFDGAKSMATDHMGNVIVTGWYDGEIDFDPGPGITNLISQRIDYFIVKYDANGSLLWVKSLNCDSSSSIGNISLKTMIGDGFVVAGGFSGRIDFNPDTSIVTELTSIGEDDVFVAKFHNDGSLIWAKNLGGSDDDEARGLALGHDGSVYITGNFFDTADFDPDSLTSYALTATAMCDIFICKLDSLGSFSWAKSYGDLSFNYGTAIISDNLGNIYVAGNYSGTIDFNSGIPGSTLSAAGENDVFILKLNGMGYLQWATSGGGASFDFVQGVSLDKVGNIFITGSFFGISTNFGPFILNNSNTTGNSNDAYIAKLDTLSMPTNILIDESVEVLKCYPNPANSLINLVVPTFIDANIIMLDLTGRLILNQNFSNEITLDIHSYPEGTYLLELRNKNGELKRLKVIKY